MSSALLSPRPRGRLVASALEQRHRRDVRIDSAHRHPRRPTAVVPDVLLFLFFTVRPLRDELLRKRRSRSIFARARSIHVASHSLDGSGPSISGLWDRLAPAFKGSFGVLLVWIYLEYFGDWLTSPQRGAARDAGGGFRDERLWCSWECRDGSTVRGVVEREWRTRRAWGNRKMESIQWCAGRRRAGTGA